MSGYVDFRGQRVYPGVRRSPPEYGHALRPVWKRGTGGRDPRDRKYPRFNYWMPADAEIAYEAEE